MSFTSHESRYEGAGAGFAVAAIGGSIERGEEEGVAAGKVRGLKVRQRGIRTIPDAGDGDSSHCLRVVSKP